MHKLFFGHHCFIHYISLFSVCICECCVRLIVIHIYDFRCRSQLQCSSQGLGRSYILMTTFPRFCYITALMLFSFAALGSPSIAFLLSQLRIKFSLYLDKIPDQSTDWTPSNTSKPPDGKIIY